ncbi:MAG: histidine kinase dimerization/phosphoacceptor domain -containing protein [Balneolaceae bacterium]|nr:histidine kinase dimerization/phosphoacceptor domain -containing protein [Balneolaceae bacterium]
MKDRSSGHTLALILLFIIAAVLLLVLNDVGSRLHSGVRAYTAGEGQWTKAQKEAALALVNYASTGDIETYQAYLNHLEVIEGARMARTELNASSPDYSLVRNSFLRAENRPENIPHLIWFYENYTSFPQFRRAIDYWIEGDVVIGYLSQTGEELFQLISSDDLTDSMRRRYISRIHEIDATLSAVEEGFASSIHESAQWTTTRIYWVNVIAVILAFLITGTYTTVRLVQMARKNRKLDKSKKRYANVLNHSRDIIYQLDIKTGRYRYMTPSAKHILGYDVQKLKSGGIAMMMGLIHPDDQERVREDVITYGETQAEDKLKTDIQFRVRKKNGEYIWINNRRALLKSPEGKPIAIIGNVRDISRDKEQIDALDASLKEKETLLSEIHHRVKNNLSIVSSLVELQKTAPNAGSEESFNEIQNRIKSIALVHEKLYENETFSDVDLSDYLDDLLNMIHFTFDTGQKNVEIERNLDSLSVNIKRAVPIGLICNEMINNCYKYAFEGREEGHINVQFKVNGQKASLTVQDNGIGLPEDFEEKKQQSLGMTLIEVLTKQVEGELRYESNGGSSFTVEFGIN